LETTTGQELAQRIRAARSRNGWSLADVARRSGVSRAYVHALEQGRAKRPGADALRRLEDVLGPLQSGPAKSDATIPAGLARVAEERSIPPGEVRMLAGLRVGGRQPSTQQRWRFIYDAIVASERLDLDESDPST
jgi:transcriptional regulator with XRE-family HTH domain